MLYKKGKISNHQIDGIDSVDIVYSPSTKAGRLVDREKCRGEYRPVYQHRDYIRRFVRILRYSQRSTYAFQAKEVVAVRTKVIS